MKNYFFAIIFLSLFFAGCSASSDKKEFTPSPVYNYVWVAQQLANTDLEKVANEDKPYLNFDPEKGTYDGFGGCNRLSGTFELTGNNIKFSTAAATRMACNNMAVEDNFLKTIEKINSYKVEGKTLTLYTDGLAVLILNAMQ